MNKFLPTSRKEIELLGWDSIDVVFFSGDAFVDHPSFCTAVIGRLLESLGLKVAIVPQPNWRDDLRDFRKLGKPNLFFAVTAGCMDSMVNHYTANKRIRSDDSYTAGGTAGSRPDYAVTVYSRIIKELYPEVPLIIGGIEASLRRLTHYDYWSDKLFPGILEDTGADLLFYGMGEKSLTEFVKLVKKGVPVSKITNIPQTAFIIDKTEKYATNDKWENVEIFSHEECLSDKIKYAKNFKIIEEESNKYSARKIIQGIGDKQIIVNPPWSPWSEKEIDEIYNLPYTRLPHPRYNGKGNIPAYDMIKYSVNIHRGCFGGCSFCTISAHQGKFIVSRSKESILKEIEKVTEMPNFKGHITDLGGPSANMYKMKGIDEDICKMCRRPSCINPTICSNLDTSHEAMLDLYAEVRKNPKIKKATVGSGLRYDLFLNDKVDERTKKINLQYFKDVLKYHVSGRLKVAPEHVAPHTLKIMRKPSFELFKKLTGLFNSIVKEEGLNHQLIPYFISSHPGNSIEDMAELAVETKDLDFRLEQVQDFTPTPMTVAEVIFYSGYHPYTLEKIYTPKSKEEKLAQRKYFFWYKKENEEAITRELWQLNRQDLIERLFGKKTFRNLTQKKKKK